MLKVEYQGWEWERTKNPTRKTAIQTDDSYIKLRWNKERGNMLRVEYQCWEWERTNNSN